VTHVSFYASSTEDLYGEKSENFTLTVTSPKAGTDNGIGTIFDHEIYISATVFHDLHKLMFNMVDGTWTNAGGLFDNLANSITDLVVSSLPVNSDGAFSFSSLNEVIENLMYSIIITKDIQTEGSTILTLTLPYAWIHTGEHIGLTSGPDLIVEGKLELTTTTIGVTDANFGIIKVPDITPVITASPNVMHGFTNFNIIFKVGTKSYSVFEFNAIFDAGFMKGIYTLTSQILQGSGSENHINNNVDVEKIDYFIY
jgi:hypothetical protein